MTVTTVLIMHFEMYRNIESLYCVTENIMWFCCRQIITQKQTHRKREQT